MKLKSSLLIRLFAVVMALMCALGASAAEAYACYTPSNTTLAFYYDNQRDSRPGTTYSLPTGVSSPGWKTDNTNASVTQVVFDSSFAGARPTTTYQWFSGMENLQSITGLSYLNTSNVTDMCAMFQKCYTLTSLDVSGFNTSNVTDMSYMFNNCKALTTNLDLSSFDTHNVTNMTCMFQNCHALKTIYVGDGWSTDAVTYSEEMFRNCSKLVGCQGTVYDANHMDKEYAHIDGGTSNPGYLSYPGAPIPPDPPEAYACYTPSNTTLAFYYDNQRDSRPGTTYGLPIGVSSPGWYTDNTNASVTQVVFDSSFAGARPTTTYQWFSGMENLQSITGLSYLNTSNVTRMAAMFQKCYTLTSLDVSGFNTSNVTDMSYMFNNCKALTTNLDLSSFDTHNVTNMTCMFQNCIALKTIYVGDGWSTDAVTYSEEMFRNCSKLVGCQGTVYDVHHMDKEYAHVDGGNSNPGYLSYPGAPAPLVAYACSTPSNTTLTFYYDNQRDSRPGTTYSLNTSDYLPEWYENRNSVTQVVFDSSFAGARPTNTHYWFYGMKNLQSITGLSYLNTSNATIMTSMFNGCEALTSLDLSSFDTHNVTDMTCMFQNCTALKTIYVGNGWSTANVTNSTYMFRNCTSLVGGQGTTYNAGNPQDKTYAHIDGGTSNPGYFTDDPHVTAAYACYTPSNTTLTFYYDDQRASRPGTTYSLNTGTSSPGWLTNASDVTRVVFHSSFAGARPTSTREWFLEMENLATVTGLQYLKTGEVTDMADMFNDCCSLTSLDVSGFDTRNVTNMGGMFCGCVSVTALDVSGFDTRKVTRMSDMFSSCEALTSLDLTHFNTAQVTRMDYMFSYCTHLTSLDLSSFDTQNVTDMGYMFQYSDALKTICVGNAWSTAKVTASTNMFRYCTSLVGGRGTTYNAGNPQDKTYAHIDGGTANPGYFVDTEYLHGPYALLSTDGTTLTFYNDGQRTNKTSKTYSLNWPADEDPYWYQNEEHYGITQVVFHSSFATARPTSTREWFLEMENLATITGMQYLNTSQVTDMSYMFCGCYSLTSLDVGGFDTHNVTNMYGMFCDCSNVTTLDVSDFDTHNVTDMNSMFSGCSSVTTLDVSGFDTRNVTDMSFMFYVCGALTSLDLTPFNTAQVTSMQGMFGYCSQLASIDLTHFNTASVTNMSHMFYSCSSLTSLDLTHFNTASVTNMLGMFYGCNNLTSLDLSSFDTQDVTSMGYMFQNCTALKTVYVGNDWSTAKVTASTNMFRNCTSLVGGLGTTYNASNPQDKTYAHIDGGTANPGYFSEKSAALRGDVNNDGKVDVTDVNIVVNIILGKDQAINYDGRADVNNSGGVDVSDVNTVVNIVLGKE